MLLALARSLLPSLPPCLFPSPLLALSHSRSLPPSLPPPLPLCLSLPPSLFSLSLLFVRCSTAVASLGRCCLCPDTSLENGPVKYWLRPCLRGIGPAPLAWDAGSLALQAGLVCPFALFPSFHLLLVSVSFHGPASWPRLPFRGHRLWRGRRTCSRLLAGGPPAAATVERPAARVTGGSRRRAENGAWARQGSSLSGTMKRHGSNRYTR